MSITSKAHRESENLAAQAAALMIAGLVGDARSLYAHSAALEETAVASVSPATPRTRGILAVSAVALYYKAGAFEKAMALANNYLAEESFPAFAHCQLEDLVATILADRRVADAERRTHETAERITVKARHFKLLGLKCLALTVGK